MPTTGTIQAWQPSPATVLDWHIANTVSIANFPQIALDLGRSALNGERFNGMESLCVIVVATGDGSSAYDIDFSSRFKSVESVFGTAIASTKALLGGLPLTDSVADPTHRAKKVVTGLTGAGGSNFYFLTVFGELREDVRM